VFHLGAQTIVGAALRDPLECFEASTRHVQSSRSRTASSRPGDANRRRIKRQSVRGIAGASVHGGDALRGRHPYDVSKSCADLISLAYASTYGLSIAVARCVTSTAAEISTGAGSFGYHPQSREEPAPLLRSDGSPTRDYLFVRAWYRLSGARRTARSHGGYRASFNFGPQSEISAIGMVREIQRAMNVETDPQILGTAKFEIARQTLDSTKARDVLGWSLSTRSNRPSRNHRLVRAVSRMLVDRSTDREAQAARAQILAQVRDYSRRLF